MASAPARHCRARVRRRLERGDRQADLRGARHVGDLDLRLLLAPAPAGPGAPGYPQPGRRVAILAEDGARAGCRAATDGLLAVSRRDPGLMLGYWRRPEETAAAFRGEWFVTGDRARDARGRRDRLSRPRRRPHERRRLPGQPGRGRGGPPRPPRRRRGCRRRGLRPVTVFRSSPRSMCRRPPRWPRPSSPPIAPLASHATSVRAPSARRRSATRSERQASPSPPEGDSPAMTRLEAAGPCRPAPARRGAGSTHRRAWLGPPGTRARGSSAKHPGAATRSSRRALRPHRPSRARHWREPGHRPRAREELAAHGAAVVLNARDEVRAGSRLLSAMLGRDDRGLRRDRPRRRRRRHRRGSRTGWARSTSSSTTPACSSARRWKTSRSTSGRSCLATNVVECLLRRPGRRRP